MIKKHVLMLLCISFCMGLTAQTKSELREGKWDASLHRADGLQIPFEIDVQEEGGKFFAYILNDTERIKTEEIVISNDSATIEMPVFESYFKVRIISKDSINGVWVKGSNNNDIVIPFIASAGGGRFPAPLNEKPGQIQGKWKIEITRPNQTKRPAIGEFIQKGNSISGSILTPSGDYRYLDGIVSGDSLFLSTFDGSHAFLFVAKINDNQLTGIFYQGASGKENWIAVKDDNVGLPTRPTVTALKEGSSGKLDFTYKDMDGSNVSLQSERYKGKVVILQIMGSWCPNCMDETAFLSEYYQKNKDRGIEVIALAYELSTNEDRSRKSLQKFQTRFNVQYPILNTGVKASDPQIAEKTLPQLTAIKIFPTTIIIDKDGIVHNISTSYYGPGAGDYHLRHITHFDKTINTLLNQK